MANAKSKKWNAHIALGYCTKCKGDIVSLRGGIFDRCMCGMSFIDQERSSGLHVRVGGLAQFVEQICPSDCKVNEHRKNVKNKNSATSTIKSNSTKKRQKRKTKS